MSSATRFSKLGLFLCLGLSVPAFAFGISGSSGRDGMSGQDGRSGQDISVRADGTQRYFDLSAGDGSPGSYGSDGEDAWSCHQPHGVEHNVYGADGGRGGDGGAGGDGGNGGDVSVYYSDINHLRSIVVRSSPGRGSYGSTGGRGGQGCRCYTYSWPVRECRMITRPDGSRVEECTTRTYYCSNGSDGRQGINGRNGFDGNYGRVELIPQLEDLQPNVNSITLALGNMGTPVTLARNQWENRSGALALFGAGSDMSNSYSVFTHRKFYPVSFRWSARRGLNEFSANEITVDLDGGSVNISPDSRIWMQAGKTQAGENTEFNILKVIKASEATTLVAQIRGSEKTTELVLKDTSGVSDLVATVVNLKLEADTMFDRNLFEGNVPANLLSISRNEIVIKVGMMDIKDKYLKRGKVLKAKFEVNRSLGGRSANWNTNWEGKIN